MKARGQRPKVAGIQNDAKSRQEGRGAKRVVGEEERREISVSLGARGQAWTGTLSSPLDGTTVPQRRSGPCLHPTLASRLELGVLARSPEHGRVALLGHAAAS